MKKIICFIKGHTRSNSKYIGKKIWRIKCRRCGYTIEYKSQMARLIGTEILLGFDGK